MKAAVCTRYGAPQFVEIREVPTPRPKPKEVLIRIIATTVSSGDWRIRSFTIPRGMGFPFRLAMGWNGPRQPILGTELVGEITEIGSAVKRFRVGDQVIAFCAISGMACHAEYRALPESANIIPRPDGLTDDEAAAFSFGGTTALHFLRDKGQIQSGQRLLILGASGSVGSAAIQIARHFGAEITAVTSPPNIDLVRNLGAGHVIDYKAEDFTRNGQQYDLILDTVNAVTFAHARPSLTATGRLLMVAAELPGMLTALLSSFSTQRAISSMAPERREDLEFLAQLAQSGHYKPVIDSTYPLDQIQQAHTRVETGRKRGNVVVRVG
jgi:NADPH:quinone reductase-like Zn-dependent oxidoreductase